ncbi:MAG TPA: hypothetical protein ENI87_05450 [bacterium]|nr:hypothetical protein [bacterium]
MKALLQRVRMRLFPEQAEDLHLLELRTYWRGDMRLELRWKGDWAPDIGPRVVVTNYRHDLLELDYFGQSPGRVVDAVKWVYGGRDVIHLFGPPDCRHLPVLASPTVELITGERLRAFAAMTIMLADPGFGIGLTWKWGPHSIGMVVNGEKKVVSLFRPSTPDEPIRVLERDDLRVLTVLSPDSRIVVEHVPTGRRIDWPAGWTLDTRMPFEVMLAKSMLDGGLA